MIEVQHLHFQYPGTNGFALQDLNFLIPKGEVFGFLGPSGSGKSTTQKILFKLLPGYQGAARIEGKEVREWGVQLYEKIGVGFELPNHYLKLSALENLEFFRAFYPRGLEPMSLLEKVGLGAEANKKVANFSKGMKMRLNFARALLHDPEILFLDEPTSGLDPGYGRMIKDMILELKAAGKTIFITTHKMYDADELCDRVAFIVDGQLKALDTPQQLKLENSHHQVEVQVKGHREKQVFPLDGLGGNQDFLQLIQQHEVETIHSKEATLDEVFLNVTGKTLLG